MCLSAICIFYCYGQKKNVDFAQKLIGTEKLKEARSYLHDAMSTHPTDSDARTWYVAGLVEWRSYTNDIRKRQINPKDASVKDADMASKMLVGLGYFDKAMHLDSLPDKKGKVKMKYSPNILEEYDKYAYDLYRAGAIEYNAKKYFPEAYTGFMRAADIAEMPGMEKASKMLPDSLRSDSYYYAGISAWLGNEMDSALHAFDKALTCGLNDPEAYIFKMAIWESKLKSEPNNEELKDSLLATSSMAYNLYGISNPAFLSRSIDILNHFGRSPEALELLNKAISKNPNEAWLYGIRAWTNELLGKDDDAIYDYLKAAESGKADAMTLIRGAHKLYRTGADYKETIAGTKKQQAAKRKAILQDFIEPAYEMATRASNLTHDASQLELINNLLENINYLAAVLK